jgi:murein L,D-transpeptidase YcbB/YkuD
VISVTLLIDPGKPRALAADDPDDSGSEASQTAELAAAFASKHPEWIEPSPGVEGSVRKLLQDHGIADGVIGPNTLRGLNRTTDERLRLLALNLDRARLLPGGLGVRHLIVNLPSGRLMGFAGGELGIDMRVVFGSDEPGTRTRLFADQMGYLVFRPYWNIPAGIARDEIIPAARKDASFLSARHYEIVPDFGHSGTAISPDSAALAAVEDGSLKIRQRPGSKNALGLVKFLFPNDHAIYLHDTPQDDLFSRSQRAFSHGCIRVEHPKQLAEWVLAPEGWSKTEVSEALSHGDNRHVQLDNPIPVYIVYFTAMPEWRDAEDRENIVRYYHDVYDRDRGRR